VQQTAKILISLAFSLSAVGCGTIADSGGGARLDHWGPIPVLCLGKCEVLDPYYYDRDEKAAARGEAMAGDAPVQQPSSANPPGAEATLAPEPNLPSTPRS